MSKCNTYAERPTLHKGRPFFVALRAVLILFFALTPVFVCGQTVDEEIKALCNKVMLNIYKQILVDKEKYPELAKFGEKNLFENQQGIYAIVYQMTDPKISKTPFEFGATIVPIKNKIFEDQGVYAFNLEFPFLDLKFAGYGKKSPKHRYEILNVLNEYGIPLSDYQQKFMPLQLRLETDKAQYKVKEPIKFAVELKNVSKRHMWVNVMKDETLYCLFNMHSWGAQMEAETSEGQEKIILKSGESLKRMFIGEGLVEQKDVEIYCSYGMSLQGVKPSGVLKVKVAE